VPYIASDELIEAVNLAIHLGRPLLLEGEAGSGKSQLAHHVAHTLGLPLFTWMVRSNSAAQDGLYSYDAILRLHDVHLVQRLCDSTRASGLMASGRDPQNPLDYVTYGALGQAFQVRECPAVVLIDEIDKADIDFPNDLLTVLDDPREFHIPEADAEPIRATHSPIVIITSNKEKGNLPAPFLRRCIYHYIRFPSDPARLKEIIAAHKAAADPLPETVVDAAIDRFVALRAKDDLFKKPGTSELLDWLSALARAVQRRTSGFDDTDGLAARMRDEDQRTPFPELLFKLRADWQRYALGG
jgi:MoxR-like ATPase